MHSRRSPGARGPGGNDLRGRAESPDCTAAASRATRAAASLGAQLGHQLRDIPVTPTRRPPTADQAVKNQSVLGWEGNYYAPFAYLSGSFFARGVTGTYTQGGAGYCGTMFSFGVFGAYPHPPGTVQWSMGDGYLPALTTSFTSGNIAVSLTNFADRVAMGGHAFELVYSRVAVTNEGTSTETVDKQPLGPFASLGSVSDAVSAGQTVRHDYVVAVD